MKNFSRFASIFLIICIVFSTFCFSTLESIAVEESTDLQSVSVANIVISSINEYAVSGSFDLLNNNDVFIPELFYTTELYLTQGDSSNTISLQSGKFELSKSGTLNVKFKQNTPFRLSKGEYFMLIRVKNKAFQDIAYARQELGVIGSIQKILLLDPNTFYFKKDGKNIEIQTGPSYNTNESPIISLTAKNVYGENLKFHPIIRVYNRSFISDPIPVSETKGPEFELANNAEQNVQFTLPPMNKPASYQALVSFASNEGDIVSGVVSARYVITGVSCTILKNGILEENGILKEKFEYVGSADGSEVKDVQVKLTVIDANTKKVLSQMEKKTTIGSYLSSDTYIIPNYPNQSNLSSTLEISYNNKILAQDFKTFEMKKLTDRVPKEFIDVKNTPYESSANWLSAMGISLGYPDGTFRPTNNVSRGELVCLLLRMYGMENDANNLNDITSFPDMKKNSWDTGAINLAFKNGILKGYPDGTFKSANPVSHLELFTIVIKNYEGDKHLDSTLKWPENYEKRAQELHLTKDIAYSKNSLACRGDVSIILQRIYELSTKE